MATKNQETHTQPTTYLEEDFINDIDPMLESGAFKVSFNRSCSLEIRETNENGDEMGAKTLRGIRIMASPNLENYTEIKIEITSEENIYQIFECRINEKKFEKIKKSQSLNFNFSNFLSMLSKLLTSCHKFPESFFTIFTINKQGVHHFVIIENIEYKSIELLDLEFEFIDSELQKECISFRFNLIKTKNESILAKIEKMKSLVRHKNANLVSNDKKANSYNATSFLNDMNRSTFR